jgi:hypothetical protein
MKFPFLNFICDENGILLKELIIIGERWMRRVTVKLSSIDDSRTNLVVALLEHFSWN